MIQNFNQIDHVVNTFWFTGNAGGYLGLFLGYALLNVPELVKEALNWWNKKKSTQISTMRR